jgi:hypothetical protein
MAVHQIVSIDASVKYLQQTPVEVEALFHDLLIGVISFFHRMWNSPQTMHLTTTGSILIDVG